MIVIFQWENMNRKKSVIVLFDCIKSCFFISKLEVSWTLQGSSGGGNKAQSSLEIYKTRRTTGWEMYEGKALGGQIKYLEYNSRCVFEIWFEEENQGEENDFLASRQLHGHALPKSLGDFYCAGMDSMRMELQTTACFFHCCKLH